MPQLNMIQQPQRAPYVQASSMGMSQGGGMGQMGQPKQLSFMGQQNPFRQNFMRLQMQSRMRPQMMQPRLQFGRPQMFGYNPLMGNQQNNIYRRGVR